MNKTYEEGVKDGYVKGYAAGLTVLGLDKLLFAATAVESAANWIAKSERSDSFVQADRTSLAVYASVITEALASISKSLPMIRTREAAE